MIHFYWFEVDSNVVKFSTNALSNKNRFRHFGIKIQNAFYSEKDGGGLNKSKISKNKRITYIYIYIFNTLNVKIAT